MNDLQKLMDEFNEKEIFSGAWVLCGKDKICIVYKLSSTRMFLKLLEWLKENKDKYFISVGNCKEGHCLSVEKDVVL